MLFYGSVNFHSDLYLSASTGNDMSVLGTCWYFLAPLQYQVYNTIEMINAKFWYRVFTYARVRLPPLSTTTYLLYEVTFCDYIGRVYYRRGIVGILHVVQMLCSFVIMLYMWSTNSFVLQASRMRDISRHFKMASWECHEKGQRLRST